MQHAPETSFYIVRDQEQEGPITLEAIHSLLASGEVQPEHLCWTEGMEAWVPVRSVAAPVSSVPASFVPQVKEVEVNPYAPPKSEISDEVPRLGRGSSYGGISRAPYWVITGGLSIMQGAMSEKASGSMILGVFVAFILGTLWVCLMRIKNLGISRWWLLWMCVPVLNLVAGYRFMFCPEGWGDTRTLDKKGKIALGLFIALILLAFVGVLFVERLPDPESP
jgi:hypothetical protein